MVNIRQIAKISGYSVSSVSRVINNHPYVSSETREKILKVMKDLDYAPSIVAQELSSGNTYKIGVVIPHTRHPYFTQLLNGMMDAAQESRYNLLLLPSQYDIDLEMSYLEQLRGHGFDHLIFTSRSVSLETIMSYTKYGNILCCEETNQSQLSSVYVDRTAASIEAFRWLQERNLDKIALLFTRADKKSLTYRSILSAYKEVFQEKQPPLILDGIACEQDGYEAAQQLQKRPELTCIFTNGDDVAAGISRYYQEKKLKLPCIIGQENLLVGRLMGIPTIDNKSYLLGRKCFQPAISTEKRTIVLQSEFIPR